MSERLHLHKMEQLDILRAILQRDAKEELTFRSTQHVMNLFYNVICCIYVYLCYILHFNVSHYIQ